MQNNYKLHEQGERPWGKWEVIGVADSHIVKCITVKPHSALSLQMHQHRAENWTIVSGEAVVTIGDEKRVLKEQESIDIPAQCKHRLENKTDKPLVVVEVQTGPILDENDIIRFEDNYNRVTAAIRKMYDNSRD